MGLVSNLVSTVNPAGVSEINLDSIVTNYVNGAVKMTLTGGDAESLSQIRITDFDGAADRVEVVFDLSTFTSDFELQLFDERPVDTILLQDAQEVTENADGSQSVTFVGGDGETYTLSVELNDAVVRIPGTEIGPGAGRDVLAGFGGDDTISAGAGDDTVDGGAGDDVINSGVEENSLGGSGARATDFPLIRLGNHADIDTLEHNGRSENAEDLIGEYGGEDQPLNGAVVFARANDLNDDDRINDDDDGKTAETYTIDGVEYGLDSVQVYDAVVTFTDGTTGEFTAVVIQMQNGDVYLAPEPFENDDSALLQSKPIESISLDRVVVDNTNLYGLRLDMDYQITDDDMVDGGAGDDTIATGIGDDTVLGGVGADSVIGGAGDDSLEGGSGDDVILGGSGDDELRTGSGNDSLFGGIGADTLRNSSGDDLLSGGSGDDSIVASIGADTLLGEGGRDTLIGGSGDDSLVGGSGDDVLLGVDFGDEVDTGQNTLFGGAGDDVAAGGTREDSIFGGTGADRIEGRGGDDTLFGGAGDDIIVGFDAVSISSSDPSVLVDDGSADVIDGGSGDDTISGGGGADSLIGGAGADNVLGGSGDDSLIGGSGDDTLFGGAGADSLRTGSGNDALFGGSGDDTLRNSSGDDSLVGGSGDDLIVASIGRDTLEGGAGDDTLIGGSGDDSLFGGSGDDQLFGSSGDDQIFGGDGQDTIFLEDDFGADSIFGGEGGVDGDTLDFSSLSGPVTVTFTGDEAGTVTDGADTLTFSGIERIVLTTGDDVVFGGADGSGVEIVALSGNDTVIGGSGDDTIFGGVGADDLDGGRGADQIFGGSGGDSIDGASGDDSLEGGTGGDTIIGGAGGDTLFGGAGADALDGGDSNDQVDGGSGDDAIDGGSGADTLTGGAGDDTIDGGAGDDLLTGGEGFDVFTISSGDDTIADFGVGAGGDPNDGDPSNNDLIDLSAYYDNISEARADLDDDGLLNQSNATDDKGRAVDYSDNDAMSGSTAMTGTSSSDLNQENTNLVCFDAETLILTPEGERAARRLKVGDLVVTLDGDPMPIRWIDARTVSAAAAEADPSLRAVIIRAGALGPGAPQRDLCVSPQHRIFASGPIAERMFGEREVLVIAKSLVGHPGVEAERPREVNFVHFALDSHEIVFADGAASETFYPGPQALNGLTPRARTELHRALPALANASSPDWPPARKFVNFRLGAKFAARSAKNGKPLALTPAPERRIALCVA